VGVPADSKYSLRNL